MPGFGPKKKKKATLEEKINAIDPNFIDSLNGANLELLKAKLAEVAKSEEANQSAKKADADLTSKKDAAAEAALGYKEITQKNRLKFTYVIRQLSDKGDAEAQTIIMNHLAAASMRG